MRVIFFLLCCHACVLVFWVFSGFLLSCLIYSELRMSDVLTRFLLPLFLLMAEILSLIY